MMNHFPNPPKLHLPPTPSLPPSLPLSTMSTTALLLLRLLLADFLVLLATGQPFDYPTATPPTTWTYSPSLPHTISYSDGTISALLLRGQLGPSFAFGFFSPASNPNASLLAIFIVYTNSGSLITQTIVAPPQLVWSPNRHHLVKVNATLQLSPNTGLVLRDSDGSLVWSTNTTVRISSLNVTDTGNLVLLDNSNATVWSSFDHPTDSMLIGQSLKEGQRLTANVSATNSTQGRFYLTLLSDGLHGYINSNPPQLYYEKGIDGTKSGNRSSYMTFTNGSLQVFALFTEPGKADMVIQLPTASSVQYMKLESDGHLRIYQWENDNGWKMAGEVMNGLGDCEYPTVCGSYGVCSGGQCSCPNGTYFKEVDARQVNLGCSRVTPLSCRSIQDHRFVALDDVSYFNYLDLRSVVLARTNAESCRQACLNNCSCQAALFQYGGNSSQGSCYLPSELFSLMNNRPSETHYNSTAYIKVQINPTPPNGSASASPSEGETSVGVIVGSIIGALLAASLVIGIVIMWLRRKRANEMEEEDHFDQVPGMPTRFSYQQLKVATDDFCRKLGAGGFGSVFEGTLGDGMRIAVKRLDNIGQGKREFLAEVETIGSIHHINLVRLVGFCAEKSHRLLVYEYMCNGSLEKWIFVGDKIVATLDWPTRRKIITDVAKGLSYLHAECRQIIAHLDIKPQNILLDDKFNAKVSDFGLSKLINRDVSHVVTGMRGTPGYLAPEWLTSIITEKVDVYSFGVVVMEILCGRKNLDGSQSSERVHLIGLLQEKVKSECQLDLIDSHIDLQMHRNEILDMMKLSMWCLQSDANRRPSMSIVVKFLEGAVNVEDSLDYDFSGPTQLASRKGNYLSDSTPLLPSILSGPR